MPCRHSAADLLLVLLQLQEGTLQGTSLFQPPALRDHPFTLGVVVEIRSGLIANLL